MKLKQGKKWIGSMLLLAGIVVMLSTTEEVEAATKKPEISKKALNMTVNQQKKLSVKHKKGYSISWKSSKKAVATVSKTGKVKAKKNGNTKITALIKPIKGVKSYRLICKVSVEKVKKQEKDTAQPTDREKNVDQNSSGKTPGTPMPTHQGLSGESESNPGLPGQSGSVGEKTEQEGVGPEATGQPGSTGQMPEQPGLDPGVPELPGSTGQPPEQPPVDKPAGSTTGSAVTGGEVKLLFSNYNDGIGNGNFFGNQMIVSYEQLQNLIAEIKTEMANYGNWKQGYDQLQWYSNQLEKIGQDYFADHVLFIHTMNVARGYEYTLDSVASVIRVNGKKELYLNLKQHYNLKDNECVTADMPYYSFFIQLTRELVDCDNIECNLMSDRDIVPSDDPDYLFTIQDVVDGN